MSHASMPNVLALAAELLHVLVVLCPESCGLAESAARTSALCPPRLPQMWHWSQVHSQLVAPDADLRNRTMEMIKRWHKSVGEVAVA